MVTVFRVGAVLVDVAEVQQQRRVIRRDGGRYLIGQRFVYSTPNDINLGMASLELPDLALLVSAVGAVVGLIIKKQVRSLATGCARSTMKSSLARGPL